MKNLLIILVVTTLFACDKSDEKEVTYGFYLDTAIHFSIFNSQNKDLLNPDDSNHLDVTNIKLFYVINGEKKEVYDPNMDNPRNFRIFKDKNEYRIGINLNHDEALEKSITYIQWSDTDTDTIGASFRQTQNSLEHVKIWLNGILVWERGDGKIEPYFVLIK